MLDTYAALLDNLPPKQTRAHTYSHACMHAYHEGVEDRLDPCQISRLSPSCHVASDEKQEHLSIDQGASAHISTAALISTYIKTVFFLSPSPVMRNSCSIRHTCVCLCVCVRARARACVGQRSHTHTCMPPHTFKSTLTPDACTGVQRCV